MTELENLEHRLTQIEIWKNARDVREGQASVQWEYFVKRFDSIDRRLDKYDGHITKFIWAIIVVMIGLSVNFIARGGLMVGGN